ncbi:trimethylamine methyltransferase family protein [Roseobacter insulae]|uniref:trimethylamine methyltransferase family protein n=1 Tax=Roseobacter insulae TaxID=2859783 RepID=UPI0027E4783C|nr:trimethylamine methyltransferase family protein [Roseobacter insulae]
MPEDLPNFQKLSRMLPAIHVAAHHIVEPYDHLISQRRLRSSCSSMQHSDKTFMGMTTIPKNAEDLTVMCAILFGRELIMRQPVLGSPLCWAAPTGPRSA